MTPMPRMPRPSDMWSQPRQVPSHCCLQTKCSCFSSLIQGLSIGQIGGMQVSCIGSPKLLASQHACLSFFDQYFLFIINSQIPMSPIKKPFYWNPNIWAESTSNMNATPEAAKVAQLTTDKLHVAETLTRLHSDFIWICIVDFLTGKFGDQ